MPQARHTDFVYDILNHLKPHIVKVHFYPKPPLSERVLLFGKLTSFAHCSTGNSNMVMKMNMERWLNDTDRGKKTKGQVEKPVPVPLCPS